MSQSFEEMFCEGSLGRVKEKMDAALETVKKGETPSLTSMRVEQPCRDGPTVWTEINARLIVDREKGEMRFIGLTRNITETLAYGEELEELALTDRQTGLYNRHKLDEILESQYDLASRYGTPFAVMVVIPQAEKEMAEEMGERLRKKIESRPFYTVGTVTASIGLAIIKPEEKVGALIFRADGALYHSKENGRNRVAFSS